MRDTRLARSTSSKRGGSVSDWRPECEDLFRAAKPAELARVSPTEGDRERVKARLASSVGGLATGAVITEASREAATTANATTAIATASKPAMTLGLLAKVGVPLVVASSLVVALVVGRAKSPEGPPQHRASSDPRPVPSASMTMLREPPSGPLAPVVRLDDLPSEPARPPPITPRSKPVTSVSESLPSPSEEAARLSDVDAALRASDATAALRLIQDHERRFPRGALAEERDGLRSIAQCIQGDHSAAQAFLLAHPKTPLRARIENMCGLEAQR
jgi:hypothetical protein